MWDVMADLAPPGQLNRLSYESLLHDDLYDDDQGAASVTMSSYLVLYGNTKSRSFSLSDAFLICFHLFPSGWGFNGFRSHVPNCPFNTGLA